MAYWLQLDDESNANSPLAGKPAVYFCDSLRKDGIETSEVNQSYTLHSVNAHSIITMVLHLYPIYLEERFKFEQRENKGC